MMMMSYFIGRLLHYFEDLAVVGGPLKRIEADIDPSPLRDEIVGFIRDNNLRIVGDTFNEY